MEKSTHMLDWQPADAALAGLALARALGTGDDAAIVAHLDARQAQLGAAQMPMDVLLPVVSDMAAAADGFDTVLELIGSAATPDTAAAIYALSADYIALYGAVTAEEMRLLERLGEALGLARLTRAALDVAAQARAQEL